MNTPDESIPLKSKGTNGDKKCDKKFQNAQKFVYITTFIAYAMSHFARKSYTTVKKQMRMEADFSPELFSRLDTGFMFSYAVGSFFSGYLGDRLHPSTVVASGLVGSALCVFGLVVGIWLDLLKKNMMIGNIFFLAIWICHGVFQSTGGPVNTAIMGNWFDDTNRGFIFGTWTCHQYVGNIIAAIVTSLVLISPIAYWWSLVFSAIANFVWGALIYLYLPAKPSECAIQKDNDDMFDNDFDEDENGSAISFIDAIKIPAVALYALAFGFFKLVNYVLFFWLPYFLTRIFTPSTSTFISTLYDVGMMPGGIIVGVVSDLYGGRRACVIVSFLLMLCPLLFLFSKYSDVMPMPVMLILLGIMGILVGGPNNIISSAVAADLSSNPKLAHNTRSLGTVTGIINGSGSITAAIGLLFIGDIQTKYGWSTVWYLLIASTLLGCSLLVPTVYKEIFWHIEPITKEVFDMGFRYDSFDSTEAINVIRKSRRLEREKSSSSLQS
uniref:Major facilitator superfamily (MFS) profile domain-containing protein n=1 Tax=Vaucheria litorea TaxID=109269 RepID=H6WBB5_VAULI|nr:hypothetical protein [Vaucheria litorea]